MVLIFEMEELEKPIVSYIVATSWLLRGLFELRGSVNHHATIIGTTLRANTV